MNRHFDFFSQRLADPSGRGREFLEIGRVAGRFPAATTAPDPAGGVFEVNVWCSNDYLGMGQHPAVVAAMQQAAGRFGAGSGGSRNIAGTNHQHVLLERELADLHGKEEALLFTSGYTANDGALAVLAGIPDDCVVFSDELNHASIIDGIRHSGAAKRIFRHNDAGHLDELLAEAGPDRPKLVVLESVYSMSGDVAPLAEVAATARRHGATTYLDEVHAVGMYGPQGAGLAAEAGLADEFTVVMGTLAKGFGVSGGYVAGPAALVDAVRGLSRPFIFTTSLPPAVAAAALAAVRHLRTSESERDALRRNARLLHRLLTERRIPFLSDRSHIVSVLVGEDELCRKASALLLQRHGDYIQPINAPSVRPGEEILRIAPSAVHGPEDVRRLVDALDTVWRDLDAPRADAPRADGPHAGPPRTEGLPGHAA
ncbi:5-aminolevulinate synthase [Kitasatospora sp. NPDC056181]|uniref:5-aminolevulinate synthase n=1 Tax=Kitasatospora sp. NPDC056181 TaxID=3345737 RepID=UPI0035D5F975